MSREISETVSHKLHCPACGTYAGTRRTRVGFRAVAISAVKEPPPDPVEGREDGLEARPCRNHRRCRRWILVEVVWVGEAANTASFADAA